MNEWIFPVICGTLAILTVARYKPDFDRAWKIVFKGNK